MPPHYQTIINIIGIGGYIISAIVTIWLKTNKQKTELVSEISTDGAKLINILKTTVDQQTVKINELTTTVARNESDILDLKKSNEVMTKVLQGRDETTQEFYRQGFHAMAQTKQIIKIVTSTNRNVEKLFRSINTYLQKHQ